MICRLHFWACKCSRYRCTILDAALFVSNALLGPIIARYSREMTAHGCTCVLVSNQWEPLEPLVLGQKLGFPLYCKGIVGYSAGFYQPYKVFTIEPWLGPLGITHTLCIHIPFPFTLVCRTSNIAGKPLINALIWPLLPSESLKCHIRSIHLIFVEVDK